MYRDPRYDNSVTANCRRRFCGCFEQKQAGRFRRGQRYQHRKAAVFFLLLFGVFLWYHTGTETRVTALRGGGLGGSILVVGGFGYVGTAIAEGAMDQDYKVFAMDSSSAYSATLPRTPLVTRIDSDDVSGEQNAASFADAMRMAPNGVDHLIYAAGVQDNGAQHSIWDTTDGVRSAVEWCIEHSVSEFILLSSMEVCHLSPEEPNADGSAQVEACTAPAESLLRHKKAAGLTQAARKALEMELVVETLCDASDQLKCAVLRLSDPYGPGIEDGPVASVIAKVVAGEPVDVPEMDVPRDYIHTIDVAHAVMRTARMRLSKETVMRVGICSGVTVSVEMWARVAIDTSISSTATIRLPSQRDNGPGFTCDVHRAWRKMSFQAAVGIDEGIMTLLPGDDEPQGFLESRGV